MAPYNAHVAVLRATLPAGARVGTVDKFQGQEAPIVISDALPFPTTRSSSSKPVTGSGSAPPPSGNATQRVPFRRGD